MEFINYTQSRYTHIPLLITYRCLLLNYRICWILAIFTCCPQLIQIITTNIIIYNNVGCISAATANLPAVFPREMSAKGLRYTLQYNNIMSINIAVHYPLCYNNIRKSVFRDRYDHHRHTKVYTR